MFKITKILVLCVPLALIIIGAFKLDIERRKPHIYYGEANGFVEITSPTMMSNHMVLTRLQYGDREPNTVPTNFTTFTNGYVFIPRHVYEQLLKFEPEHQ